MPTRAVEISFAPLTSLPWEVLVLAIVYTMAPLLVALAVVAGAKRVAAALHRLDTWSPIEPVVRATSKSPQDAAYEAVRDWYAVDGSPAANACYMLLSNHTKRHD
jgi:hypothetical protein